MVAAIRTTGLTKAFGRTVALRPLDLEVAAGEVLGYLGPNGAGKTTTIRCLLGMIRATAGRAEIFGVPRQALPAIEDTAATSAARARRPGEARAANTAGSSGWTRSRAAAR